MARLRLSRRKANGRKHVNSTRLHHAVHRILPTLDLLERRPQAR